MRFLLFRPKARPVEGAETLEEEESGDGRAKVVYLPR